jgi:acyl-CoA dehydrogenase
VPRRLQGKKDVLGIRLTWEKRYITLGPIATLLGLAFRLYDPDHLLSAEEDRGITLGLIPTDTSGVNIGRRHFPLNGAFMNGPNWGKDVFVPMDYVIGGVDYVGQGWKMLITALRRGVRFPCQQIRWVCPSSRAHYRCVWQGTYAIQAVHRPFRGRGGSGRAHWR